MSVTAAKPRTALFLLGISAFYVILFWGIWQFFADIPLGNQVLIERLDNRPVFFEISWLPGFNRFVFDLAGFPLLLTSFWLMAQKCPHLSQPALIGFVEGLVIGLFSVWFGLTMIAGASIIGFALYLVFTIFVDLINVGFWLLKRDVDQLSSDTAELVSIIAPMAAIAVVSITFNFLFGFVLFVAYSAVALSLTFIAKYLRKMVRQPFSKTVEM